MIQEIASDNEGSEKDTACSSLKHKDNGVKSSLRKDKLVRGWFPRKCAVEILSDDSYYDDRSKSTNNKKQRTKEGSEAKLKSRSRREGKKRQ